jgi:hypothetical protein
MPVSDDQLAHSQRAQHYYQYYEDVREKPHIISRLLLAWVGEMGGE